MDFTLEFEQGQAIDAGTIYDRSTYGGSNPERSERANVLLLSQNDKNGNRTYLTVPNTTPLSSLSWTFTHEKDAWHQATILSFELWNSSDEFTGGNNAVYHSDSGKFFKCLDTNTNVEPTSGSGPLYWEEITDFTDIQQGYDNVDVTDYDFPVKSRIDMAILDEVFEALGETFICKFQPEEAVDVLNLIATREGFLSKFIVDEPNHGEEIIRTMEACLE